MVKKENVAAVSEHCREQQPLWHLRKQRSAALNCLSVAAVEELRWLKQRQRQNQRRH